MRKRHANTDALLAHAHTKHGRRRVSHCLTLIRKQTWDIPLQLARCWEESGAGNKQRSPSNISDIRGQRSPTPSPTLRFHRSVPYRPRLLIPSALDIELDILLLPTSSNSTLSFLER